jgi:hypothetical protein
MTVTLCSNEIIRWSRRQFEDTKQAVSSGSTSWCWLLHVKIYYVLLCLRRLVTGNGLTRASVFGDTKRSVDWLWVFQLFTKQNNRTKEVCFTWHQEMVLNTHHLIAIILEGGNLLTFGFSMASSFMALGTTIFNPWDISSDVMQSSGVDARRPIRDSHAEWPTIKWIFITHDITAKKRGAAL